MTSAVITNLNTFQKIALLLTHNYDDFSHCFFDKVDAVHRCTEGSPDLLYFDVHMGCLIDKFTNIGSDAVIASIRRLPDKQLFCDVLPVSVLRQVVAGVHHFWLASTTVCFQPAFFPHATKRHK